MWYKGLLGFFIFFGGGAVVFDGLFFLKIPSTRLSAYSGSRHQNPPLPGSSLDLGTFRKHLFKERLWRMEFCNA